MANVSTTSVSWNAVIYKADGNECRCIQFYVVMPKFQRDWRRRFQGGLETNERERSLKFSKSFKLLVQCAINSISRYRLRYWNQVSALHCSSEQQRRLTLKKTFHCQVTKLQHPIINVEYSRFHQDISFTKSQTTQSIDSYSIDYQLYLTVNNCLD